MKALYTKKELGEVDMYYNDIVCWEKLDESEFDEMNWQLYLEQDLSTME